MKVIVTYSYTGHILPGLDKIASRACEEIGTVKLDARNGDFGIQKFDVEMKAAAMFQKEAGLSAGADSFVFECLEVE